jgi:hypothetical protein
MIVDTAQMTDMTHMRFKTIRIMNFGFHFASTSMMAIREALVKTIVRASQSERPERKK